MQDLNLLGRDGKQWLSIIRQDESASGEYIASETIFSRAKEQYKDNCPFNYPVYDGSPLNRVVEQYGPGEAWQQGGYSTKNEYRINVINDRCLNFGVNGEKGKPELMLKGFFSPNELEVTETEDEDGHATFRFTDKNGNAILQRNITEKDTLDTYYVYDVYSNLCFVLPPAATDIVALLSPFDSSPQEILDKYAYQYCYDYRDRCIGKQLPGCGKTEQMYDVNNRLIFTQDGEQKKRTEWSFQLFDTLNRTVLSGIYHGTPDRQECSGQNVYVSTKSDDPFMDPDYDPDQPIEELTLAGYILHCPSSINSDSLEVLKANYYDSYDYKNKISGFDSSLDYVEDENYGKRYVNGEQALLNCKDLLTGSMVRVLDTDRMLYSCFYYDYNRNLIQDRHITVNGKTAVSKSAFNFSSQPTATCEEYDDSIRLGKRYTYDHAKRLTKETHAIGNDTICFLYSYDETGRIKSLTRISGNDSLTTTNSYNIRDWLTAIDSPIFKQSLHYTDGVGTPCYNGNVSSMTWQTDSLTTRGYQFSYDSLSRLKAAVYGEGSSLTDNLNRFDEQVTAYDKMGNILGIKRHGQTAENDYGIIDNLSLTYNGNQLEAVNDNATHNAFNNSFEFKDGAKQAIEYTYDANGNLTQDLNKKITEIQYNCLNLPGRIEFEDGNTISFLYDANGTKLRTMHIIDGITTTTDYCDNAIYENGALKLLLTESGYITLSDTTYHYFLQDHQGNNSAVVNQNGTVEEVNNYYPFGGVFSSTSSVQPYKYNGKELDRRNGLDWYDYGARMYDAAIGRWHAVDLSAEKFYFYNAYNYCFNNPIKYVDPDGNQPQARPVRGPIRRGYRNGGRPNPYAFYPGGVRPQSYTKTTYMTYQGNGTRQIVAMEPSNILHTVNTPGGNKVQMSGNNKLGMGISGGIDLINSYKDFKELAFSLVTTVKYGENGIVQNTTEIVINDPLLVIQQLEYESKARNIEKSLGEVDFTGKSMVEILEKLAERKKIIQEKLGLSPKELIQTELLIHPERFQSGVQVRRTLPEFIQH